MKQSLSVSGLLWVENDFTERYGRNSTPLRKNSKRIRLGSKYSKHTAVTHMRRHKQKAVSNAFNRYQEETDNRQVLNGASVSRTSVLSARVTALPVRSCVVVL